MHDVAHGAALGRQGNASAEARHAAHPRRSAITRILHLTLLLIVVHQLIGSEFMERPFPGDPPGALWLVHQWIGLAGFGAVTAFWGWTLVRRGETAPGKLVPWFSARGIAAVLADLATQLRRALRGQPPADDGGALATAIHGAGLLAVTVMAATGTLYFFMQGHPAARPVLEVHKTVANLVWAYLILHAGMAALHHLLGADILSRIFWAPRRGRAALRPWRR